MNALTQVGPRSALAFNEIERLSISIARSGLFGMKTPEQALALMMIAHAEGQHPALAARDYDIINGRPTKKAEAMQRDFLSAGGKIEWHALNDETADATFSHHQGGSVRITWDKARATQAGLWGKDTWKKFPRAMLRSRTVSEGVRTVWPLATSGFYVPEEAVDFNGKTIEAEPPTTAEQINDSLPPSATDEEVPVYPFAHKAGGQMYNSAEEWIGRWRRLIRDCRAAKALDKLRSARELNTPMMAEIGVFDATTVAQVEALLDEALGEPEIAPADAMVRRIETMSLPELNRLDTSAEWRAELRELPEADYQRVQDAISGRLAELRMGA